MPDHDSRAGNRSLGLDSAERNPRSQAHAARRHVGEDRSGLRPIERKARRANSPKGPKLSLQQLVARLPDAIGLDGSPDDVCSETMLIVDLLGNDNIELI